MKLFEVQATEYNGEQEYSQTKLIAAMNIKHAARLPEIISGSGMMTAMNRRITIPIAPMSLNLSVAASD